MKHIAARLFAFLFLAGTLAFSVPSFAWTVHLGFDSGTLGQLAQGTGGFSESFATAYSNEAAYQSRQSAKMYVTAGSDGWGQWGAIHNLPARPKEGEEMWLRVASYFPSTFDYSANPHLKFLRIHTRSDAAENQGYLDLYIRNSGLLAYVNEPVGVITSEFGSQVQKGKWEIYEVYVKFSSVAGQGIFRVWQNGKLVHENRQWKTLSGSASYSDRIHIFTYWNGGAPKTQSAYIDDVVITTTQPSARDAGGNYMIGTTLYGAKVPSVPMLQVR